MWVLASCFSAWEPCFNGESREVTCMPPPSFNPVFLPPMLNALLKDSLGPVFLSLKWVSSHGFLWPVSSCLFWVILSVQVAASSCEEAVERKHYVCPNALNARNTSLFFFFFFFFPLRGRKSQSLEPYTCLTPTCWQYGNLEKFLIVCSSVFPAIFFFLSAKIFLESLNTLNWA